MRFFKSKKGVVMIATLLVAAVAAVGAYAYFTAAGTGSGTFTSGQIGNVTITNDSVGPLYPQTVALNTTPVTVHLNNAGASNQYVGQITGVVRNDTPGCDPAWFTVEPIPAPGLVPPGNHDYASSVILNDNNGNQNACANKTLTIDWSSASG